MTGASMVPFGLKEWMSANSYTIRGLAQLLEVDKSTVQRWRLTSEIPRVAELALATVLSGIPARRGWSYDPTLARWLHRHRPRVEAS